MSDREAIQQIKGIGKASTKHIEEPITVAGKADKAHFDAIMEQKKAPQKVEPRETSTEQASLFDEVAKSKGTVDPALQHTSEEIRSTIQKTISNIEQVKKDLETPNLNIKPYQKLMNNKLKHVDEQLRIAVARTGREFPVEEVGAPEVGKRFNPVEEFLGRLSHIEYQMQDMQNYVDYMALSETELNPANMLAIQMKMNHIGQEVEFFAALLNKALEGIKQIGNIQV